MRTPPAPTRPAPTLRARRAAALSAAALLIVLAGCSGGTSGGAPVAPAATAPAGGAEQKAGEATPASGTDQTEPTQRQVARTASLTLVITDPAKSAKEVRAAAEALGGYEFSENVVTEQKDGFYVQPSTVTVAVPSAKLDDALDVLSKLGEPRNRVVTAQDVTTQVVDLDARIKALRSSIARIAALMDKAGSVSEIASVESQLSQRETQLESLIAQQQSLANRVAMAPISVTLRTSVTAATVAEPNPLLQGLEAGWTALLQSLRVLITLIGALLPFAAVGAAIWLPYRAWRKKHPRTPRVVAPTGYVYANTPAGVAGPVGPSAATTPEASGVGERVQSTGPTEPAGANSADD